MNGMFSYICFRVFPILLHHNRRYYHLKHTLRRGGGLWLQLSSFFASLVTGNKLTEMSDTVMVMIILWQSVVLLTISGCLTPFLLKWNICTEVYTLHWYLIIFAFGFTWIFFMYFLLFYPLLMIAKSFKVRFLLMMTSILYI